MKRLLLILLESSCIDEEALAACQAASAECAGQVQVMESCPLQFSCGGSAQAQDSSQPDGAAPCTEGDTRPQDCNTCRCEGGLWACTELHCG